jgi:hypothetical protein
MSPLGQQGEQPSVNLLAKRHTINACSEGLDTYHPELLARLLDDGEQAVQLVLGHAGEQVVLDLSSGTIEKELEKPSSLVFLHSHAQS